MPQEDVESPLPMRRPSRTTPTRRASRTTWDEDHEDEALLDDEDDDAPSKRRGHSYARLQRAVVDNGLGAMLTLLALCFVGLVGVRWYSSASSQPWPSSLPPTSAEPSFSSSPPPPAPSCATFLAGDDGTHAAAAHAVVSVLFIGNSFVSHNGLPEAYRALITSAMPNATVTIKAVATASFKLTDHVKTVGGATLHGRRWTHVVMQEQSQIPGLLALQPTGNLGGGVGGSFDAGAGSAKEWPGLQPSQPSLDADCDASRAACRALASQASSMGAHAIVLLQTWAWRDGDDTMSAAIGEAFSSFGAMQERIAEGYHLLAAEARRAIAEAPPGFPSFEAPKSIEHANGGGTAAAVRIAPVGEAFRAFREREERSGSGGSSSGSGGGGSRTTGGGVASASGDSSAGFNRLYAEDGKHASRHGAHLAAAVLAYTLHGLRPAMPPDLDVEVAARLRAAAESAIGDCKPSSREDYQWKP